MGSRALPGPPRIVILRRDSASNTAAANAQSAQQEDTSLSLLPWSAVGPDPLGQPFCRVRIHCVSIAFRGDGETGGSGVLLRCLRDGERVATMGLSNVGPSARIGFYLQRSP